jgi:transposase
MQPDVKVERVTDLVSGHRRDGRCRYDKEAKRELVRRVMEPGVSLAATALAHGINANLLRKWVITLGGRERVGAGARPVVTAALPALVPVQMARAPASTATGEGYVEILVDGGTIRVHGRVDAAALGAVLDCLARRT